MLRLLLKRCNPGLISVPLYKNVSSSNANAPVVMNTGAFVLFVVMEYDTYGHAGDIPGFNSYMGSDPERGITVVIWVNVNEQRDKSNPAINISSTIVPMLLAER